MFFDESASKYLHCYLQIMKYKFLHDHARFNTVIDEVVYECNLTPLVYSFWSLVSFWIKEAACNTDEKLIGKEIVEALSVPKLQEPHCITYHNLSNNRVFHQLLQLQI